MVYRAVATWFTAPGECPETRKFLENPLLPVVVLPQTKNSKNFDKAFDAEGRFSAGVDFIPHTHSQPFPAERIFLARTRYQVATNSTPRNHLFAVVTTRLHASVLGSSALRYFSIFRACIASIGLTEIRGNRSVRIFSLSFYESHFVFVLLCFAVNYYSITPDLFSYPRHECC